MTLAVGIDVAKGFHWASAVDGSGAEVLSRRVDNDPGAIAGLVDELAALAGGDRFAAGVDVMGGIASLLVVMLQAAAVEVFHVPGLAVNRARQGTVGGENKSDPRDARVIAEQVRTRRAELRPIEIEDEATAELRLVVGHRRVLVADQTRRVARLHDLVVSVHPGLERALDLTNKADLWLLTRYVTPAELRRAGHRRVVEHLGKLRGIRSPRAETLATAALQAARAQHIAVPGERRAAELIRELATEALAVRDRLARLDAELEELVAAHPDGALIRSLPGMGAVLTAEFIVEAGGIERFATADKLAAAAGLAPVLKQSGRSHALRRALGGNKNLKSVFYQSAFCSLRHPASRAFYARKRHEGKRHHQAVIALARRRVDVLHAMLRTRQPFDPERTRAA
jgi:transposase